MAKEHTMELLAMLAPFPPATQEVALWLRDFVWDLYPQTNELIYDNYNALAFGWGLTDRLGDVFCSVAVYKTVNFGFNRGSELDDPEKKLLGKGSQYRYLKVADKKDFPAKYVKELLQQAYANALVNLKEGRQKIAGQTIVKSISAKKRRPG